MLMSTSLTPFNNVIKGKKLRALTLLTTILLFSIKSDAQTNSFNVTSGVWNLAGNWSAGHIPTSAEDVIIPTGKTVTATALIITVNSITVQNGGTLTTSGAQTIGVTNSLTVGNAGAGVATLTFGGTGTVSLGSLSMPANATGTSNISQTGASGAINITGNLTIGNGATYTITKATACSWGGIQVNNGGSLISATVNAKTITVGTGNIQVNAGGSFTTNSTATALLTLTNTGSYINYGTFTGAATSPGTGTITLNNTGATTLKSGSTNNFNILTCSGGLIQETGSGFTSGGLVTLSGGTSTIVSTGAGALNALTVNGTTPSLTVSGSTVTVTGVITLTGASFTVDGGTIKSNALSGNAITATGAGSITITNGGAVTAGDITNSSTANLSIAGTTPFTLSNGTGSSQLNVAGKFAMSGTGAYNQSGGAIVVGITPSNSAAAAGMFATAAGNAFTWSGGSITIQNNNAFATNPTDYNILSTTASITGGTLFLGNASTANAGNTFWITTKVPNITVDGTQNSNVNLRGALTMYGDLTMNGSGNFLDTVYAITIYGQSAANPGNIVLNNSSTITLTSGNLATNRPSLFLNSSYGNQALTNNGSGVLSGFIVSALTINNTYNSGAGTINLNNAISITPLNQGTNFLTLTSGRLISTNTNMVTLANAVQVVSSTYPNATSYVDGPVTRTYAASTLQQSHPNKAFIMPTGANGTWMPIYLDAQTNASGPVSITVNTVSPAGNSAWSSSIIYTGYNKLNRDWDFTISGTGTITALNFGVDVNAGNFVPNAPNGNAYYFVTNPSKNGSYTDGDVFTMYADQINGGGTPSTWDLTSPAQTTGLAYASTGGRFSLAQTILVPPAVTTSHPAPGGVGEPNGMQVWLKADGVITTSGSDVSSWQNSTDATYVPITTQAGRTPTSDVGFLDGSSTSALNFNPTVQFSGNGALAGTFTNYPPGISGITFAAFKGTGTSTGFTGAVFVNGIGTSGNMLAFSTATPGVGTIAADGNGGSYSSAFTFNASIPYVASADYQQTSLLNAYIKQNGLLSAASTNGTVVLPSSKNYYVGCRSTSTTAPGSFAGVISEVIYYADGNTITAAMQNKIESYLAIKYGITLDQSTATNYTNSGGSVVWDATNNAGYNNDIAGLMRDDKSSLNQKESKSVNPSSTVTVALGSLAVSNPANTNTFSSDLSSLIWGSNGAANNTDQTSVFPLNSCATKRLTRQWKVQAVNMGDKVQVNIDLSDYAANNGGSLPSANASDYALLIDDNGTSFASTDIIRGVAGSAINGNVISFNNVNLTASSTGTAMFTIAFGGTPTPALGASTTTVYCSNFGNSQYNYFKDATSGNAVAAINPNGNSGQVYSVTQSDNAIALSTQPASKTTDGANTTGLMARMYTFSNTGSAITGGVTVRLYYATQDSLDARGRTDINVTGLEKGYWFKLEGTAADVIADQKPTAFSGTHTFTKLTPSAYGTEGGVRYVEFSGITNFSTFGYVSAASMTTLPVSLINFSAVAQQNKVKLSWKTASEMNSREFIVERSANGNTDWQTISTVAAAGNSNAARNYTADDNTPFTGTSYYRLKQVDLDGKFVYSEVRIVNTAANGTAVVMYPNPVRNQVTIKANTAELQTFKIFTLSGVDVTSIVKTTRSNNSTLVADLSKLATGTYVIKTATSINKIVKE